MMSRSQLLCQSNFIASHSDGCKVYMLIKETGGRRTPFFAGYSL